MSHKNDGHQGPSNINQNLLSSEKWAIKREDKINPSQSLD